MLLPSGRVMLSANAIGDVNAHHRIRHRARHGLRGGVASPLQRFAPVVPRRRPRRPRMSRAGQARHVSCKYPALPARPERLRLGTTHSVVGGSRLPCGTCTALPMRTRSGSGQAGCRGSPSADGLPSTGRQASRPQRDSSNGLPVLFPSTTTPAPSGRSRTGSTSSAAPLRLRRRHIHTLAFSTSTHALRSDTSGDFWAREVTTKYCGFVCVFSGTAIGSSNPGGVAAPKDAWNRANRMLIQGERPNHCRYCSHRPLGGLTDAEARPGVFRSSVRRRQHTR